MLERTLRTSPVTGIRLDPVLTAVLLAELLAPSAELWLVSAWISDVIAIDNTRGDYDRLFADASARAYHLSEVLALLTAGGANLTVVTRPAEHNDTFLTRLRRRAEPRAADGDPARRRAREDPLREELAADRVDELHHAGHAGQRRSRHLQGQRGGGGPGPDRLHPPLEGPP